MKFTYAWATTASQNVTLKFVVLSLALCTVALTVSTIKLSSRDPLMIERGCTNRVLVKSSSEHTAQEIDVFVRDAVSQRFNTDAAERSVLLSLEENQVRAQEQRELSSKGMSQRVLVNSVKINGNTIVIDADRLISAGQIRSAFIFPLTLNIQSDARTDTNPYGLVLARSSPVRNTNGEDHAR